MSAYSSLDPTLKEVLKVITPSREDWVTRYNVIYELRGVVESVESLRGASVEPFGSFVSNLFSCWGDLDISIDLPNGSYISSASKKQKRKLLEQVLIALGQKGGWGKLQFISSAKVPILIFESIRYRISCDLSVDNLVGQVKSKFLLWISEMDDRFRDMVLLVKEWAKAHNINNPKSGTFNSYSLSLLVVFHFQTCVPPILPPLRDIYPRNIVTDLTGVRANAVRLITEICAANIDRFRSDKFRAVNRSSLSELFISFLVKFSDIGLKASELGICPFKGNWEEIRSNMSWLSKRYAIFIEDPFEQPENTARAVCASQLAKISEAFETTHRRLISANQNQSSILAALVKPQISQLIPRTPVIYPSYSSGRNFTPRPQVQSAFYSPARVTPQVQRALYSPARVDRESNFTTRPQVQGAHYSPARVTTRPQVQRALYSPARVDRESNFTTRPQVQGARYSPARVTTRPQVERALYSPARVDRESNLTTRPQVQSAFYSPAQADRESLW